MEKLNIIAMLACIGAFLLLTYIPYFVGLWRFKKFGGNLISSKYLSRSWLITIFPAMFVFYTIIVDGLDVMELEFIKIIVIWAMAMGVIFAIKSCAEKIVLKKGDLELNIDTRKKQVKQEKSK